MAKGRKQKIITKEQLLNAMKMTKSNMSCARYLGISYMHYSRYAKSYTDEASGKTLFDIHKNQAGRGIRKHLGGKDPDLKSLMDGELYIKSYNLNRYKDRLIQEGYIEEKCNSCGFTEQRVHDYKSPLLIHFKDKNKENWRIENIELLCYNCYFLYIGDVFNEKQVKHIEEDSPVKKDDQVDWEMDENMMQHFQEIGLIDEDDTEDYVSRI
jgi:hypothetical protein|tara:strand:+ start:5547 stop:6179 length:633 start_codon:yes stop_codon:yes gene_type:complete